jgi:hypothetical protein
MTEVGPLANQETQDAMKATRRRRSREHRQDIEYIMSTQPGRRFMYWLLFEKCAVHGSSFCGAIKDGSSAAQHAAFLEGHRDVGLSLAGDLQEICVGRYIEMMQEEFSSRARDFVHTQGDES